MKEKWLNKKSTIATLAIVVQGLKVNLFLLEVLYLKEAEIEATKEFGEKYGFGIRLEYIK